jgi:hypothetical protein
VKERGHERPVFTEGGEFLDELSECQLLNDPAAWG